MPWKETSPMDQKLKFIVDYLSREYYVTELSKMYEISRKTCYKWVKRYLNEGPPGLTERPKTALRHPNATPVETAREIVACKLKHSSWGPKKVLTWLEQRQPERQWPAFSTAGDILRREGLVKPRQKRHRTPPYTEPFQECNRPNEVWSIDYKGQFRMGNGRLCYPLTISDNYTRYLLDCHGLSHPDYEGTRQLLQVVLKRYGLPEAIRTDNGEPFASVGLGGLSKLSVWFIKLGIKQERIAKGHPEQNGRHERMHRSLKAATANPPENNLQKQQKAFDKFLPEYNTERPHESLEMQTPASLYTLSLRPYPAKLAEVTYHGDYIVRQVRHNGEIKWRGEFVYVSQALAGEPVALKQQSEGQWELRFSTVILGMLDERTLKILPLKGNKKEKVLPMLPV
jgi:putative transposase